MWEMADDIQPPQDHDIPPTGRLGWQITADIGFRIYAKRFAEGTLSFAFRISRLRFKHEP